LLLRVPSPYLCDNIKKLCTSGNKGLLAKKEVHVSRMYYMGIDLHKKYFVSTIMDKEGKVLKRSRVSTNRESTKHYFGLLKDKEPIKAVMEATFLG